jgi:hypothetical protein
VKEVLRLFDADEGRRSRVVENHQIGQHLERAIRGEAGEDWLEEGCVLDLEQETPVGHGLGQDALDPRHALPQRGEDLIETMRMLLGEELDDVGEVVARAANANPSMAAVRRGRAHDRARPAASGVLR